MKRTYVRVYALFTGIRTIYCVNVLATAVYSTKLGCAINNVLFPPMFLHVLPLLQNI